MDNLASLSIISVDIVRFYINKPITCDNRAIKVGVSVRSKPPFRWAIK